MPRPQTTDPQKYRAGSGWRVKIAGQTFRLGGNEAAAERKRRQLVGEWLKSGGPGAPPPLPPVAPPDDPAELTVGEVAAEYLSRGVRPGIGKRNKERIASALQFVVDQFEDLPAAAFGALELKRVRDALGQRRTKPKCSEKRRHVSRPLARRYINSLIGSVKTAWDWLGSERLVPAWRAHELRTLRAWEEGDGGAETADVMPAPIADVRAALEHMNPVVAAMVKLQQLTGMRPNEVRRMRRGEISTSSAEVLHPPNALPTSAMTTADGLVWVYAPSQHKTRRKGKARLIALGPKCQEILRPFMEGRAPGDTLFRPIEAAGGRTTLGGKPVAGEYTITSYAHAVRRACLAAKVPTWRPNQLRHAMATDLFPDDPLTAMATLGHDQLSMTKYYAAVTLKRAAEHAAKAG